MTPSAIAAFTSSRSRVTVLTTPMTSIAINWVTSHLRSTTAIRASTAEARSRDPWGKRCSTPSR